MLHHPCILGAPRQRKQNQSGPKRGRKCYITPAFSGVTNIWDKIKEGSKEGAKCYITPAFSGSPNKEDKIKAGPKKGAKCYMTPALSGVPNKGDKVKARPKEGGNATSPLHSRSPQQRGQNQIGPKRGQKCYITPAFSGIPNKRKKA